MSTMSTNQRSRQRLVSSPSGAQRQSSIGKNHKPFNSLRPPAATQSNLNPIQSCSHAAISPKNTGSQAGAETTTGSGGDRLQPDELPTTAPHSFVKTTTNCPELVIRQRANNNHKPSRDVFHNMKCLVIAVIVLVLAILGGGAEAKPDPGALGAAAAAAAAASGGLLPFPEGRGPDGTLYKTDYRCEGENMTVSCEASDGPGLDGSIRVVRANFGRFSIAICNRHGQTDWNVNCFAPQTTKILQNKCDGKSRCVVEVNSSNFHDACPGTLKYLEIHYACTSKIPQSGTSGSAGKQPSLPPWLIDRKNGKSGNSDSRKPKNSDGDKLQRGAKNRAGIKKLDSGVSRNSGKVATTTTASTLMVRKPILVTDRPGSNSGNDQRVPITTPSTTSRTTTTTTTVTTSVTSTILPTKPPRVEVTTTTLRRKVVTTPKPTAGVVGFDGPLYDLDEDKVDLPSVNNRFVVSPNLGPDSNQGLTSSSCPPKTSRQLQWDWTPAGQPAIQPCPIGATGLAKWACLEEAGKGAAWAGTQPDMSGCKSVAVDNLEAQVRKEDPETVLVSSLAYLTRTRSLYGGDLESTVGIMRTVASRLTFRLQSGRSFHNRESHVRQVVQDVLRSASNILEDSNRQAWMDLQPNRQKKVATNLLLALEENAFLLAGVIDEPTNILETQEIMTMAISVVDVGNRYGGYSVRRDGAATFPEKPLLFVDDSVSVPRRNLEDNAVAGNGAVAEAVFFSYSTLHQILGMHPMTQKLHLSAAAAGSGSRGSGGLLRDEKILESYVLNSRVISASLGRAGRHIQLKEPVEIQFRHLREENVTGPVCVFWDLEAHAWSDAGCRLLSTNQTHSSCACDHLTNFALLMRRDDGGLGGSGINIRIDIVAGVVAAVVAIGILVALIKYRRRIFECRTRNFYKSSDGNPATAQAGMSGWCCSTSGSASKHNLDNKCQSFYTGLSSQNHSQYVLTGQPLQAQSLLHSSASHDHFQRAATLHHNQMVHHQSHQMAAAGQQVNNPLMAQAQTLNGIKTLRPHITLNPYSTQLVESLNMVMPGNNNVSSTTSNGSSENDSGNGSENSANFRHSESSNSTTLGRQLPTAVQTPMEQDPSAFQTQMAPQLAQLTNTLRGVSLPQCPNEAPSNGDVVYRAVSPHGHVYWEIDPGQVYAAAVAANNGGQMAVPEENVSLLISGQQQAEPAELRPLMSPLILTANSETDSANPNVVSQQHQRPGPFVRNRWRQQNSKLSSNSGQPSNVGGQSAANVMQGDVLQSILQSPPPPPPGQPPQHQQAVPTSAAADSNFVQIRDIKPIQVSVKSSEYIEAKIRTMRNNNRH